MLVDTAFGHGPDSVVMLAEVAGLPPASIALPLLARNGSCESFAEVASETERSGIRDPQLTLAVAAYAERCGVATESTRVGLTDDVLSRGTFDCFVSGEVSSGVADDARRQLAALDWTWSTSAVPEVNDMYLRVVLIELEDSSCDGFWWSAIPSS